MAKKNKPKQIKHSFEYQENFQLHFVSSANNIQY